MIAAATDTQALEGGKVEISPDVMNDKVPIEALEQEMLADDGDMFKIQFSSYFPSANIELYANDKKKTIYHDTEDSHQFFSSCE